MKRKVLFIGIILIYILSIINVYAKDTVYSLNKNIDEKFNYIINSYNSEQINDGFVVGGNFLKESNQEENIEDYQVMLVKYNKNGKVKWNYTYGKNKKDKLDYLTYTYNNEHKVDGYLLVLERTYDNTDDNKSNNTVFIKIDLSGKLEYEKETDIDKITKLIEIHNENNEVDGYIAIGNNNDNTKSYIIKYDKDLNAIWNKTIEKTDEKIEYLDITTLKEEEKEIAYIILEKETKEEEKINLIKYDIDGNESGTIQSNIEKYDSYYLEKANNGFILYGVTSEVKLKNGEKSYYLINYNKNGESNWDIVGDIPINSNKKTILLPKIKDNNIKGYTLLYSNGYDDSYEVIKLDEEGLLDKKIKKIKNDYYDIEDYLVDNSIIYLVGQINCPEDDNCEYDKNSLFLISDEDKVIEVEDKDSTNILIVIILIITIITIPTIIYKKKKRLPNQ